MTNRIKNIIKSKDDFDKALPKSYSYEESSNGKIILAWKTLNNQMHVMSCSPQQFKMVEELLIESGYTKGE